MIGGETGTPRWKSTGPGTPTPAPLSPVTPTSAITLRTISSASASTTSGPCLMSHSRCCTPSVISRPSVTPTERPVAPIAMPANRMSGERSTSVDRRPPRDAAGPTSTGQPELAEPDHLGTHRGARHLERVGQLGLRERPLVPQLREEAGLELALDPPCQRVPHGRILPRAWPGHGG